MADPLDAQIDQTWSQQALTDADIDKAWGVGVPQHSMAVGMLAQALHGGTLHADDWLTSKEWQQKNARFEQQHPWASGIGQAAGFVAPMLTPAGWVARTPAAIARIAEYALPYGNFQRAASATAPWRTIMNQAGVGSLKAGAMMRFNDAETKPPPSTGDSLDDFLYSVGRRGQRAGDLPSMALDYGLGAAGGYVGNKVGGFLGNRLGTLAQKANTGTDTRGNAFRALAGDITQDTPPGAGGLDETLANIRNVVYGDPRLGRSGAGLQRGAIPQEAEQQMARFFHRLTNEQGLSDAQAADRAGDVLSRMARRADTAMQGGQAHPYGWLLANRGNAAAPDTMGGWVRNVGQAYRERNAVPSNLTELTALATGGEAPSIQQTQRTLLNLKGEGQNRSEMLRWLRTRQGQIKPQLDAILSRLTGGRPVNEVMQTLANNTEHANSLYPDIYESLRRASQGLDRAGNQAHAPIDVDSRISEALRPVIENAQQTLAREPDPISKQTLKYAEMFLNPAEMELTPPSMVPGQPQRPMMRAWTRTHKDEGGNISHFTTGEAPVLDAQGNQIMRPGTPDRLDLGSRAEYYRPSGDLESILNRRRALGDAIANSRTPQGENTTLTAKLTELKDQVSNALRGLGDANGDPFERTMARWAAANDTRATAGSLRTVYNRFSGLNLKAQKGQGLQELERALTAYRGMDPAHQQIARHGLYAQLGSILETGGDMHDAAKIFANQRSRRILQEMMGQQDADEFGNFVARSGLATNSFNMNKGSHTSSIADEGKRTGWLEGIAHAIWHGNPLSAISKVGEQVGDYMKRVKYDQMTGTLRTGTHNPADLERALENIRRAGAPPHPAIQAAIPWLRTAGTGTGLAEAKRKDNQ